MILQAVRLVFLRLGAGAVALLAVAGCAMAAGHAAAPAPGHIGSGTSIAENQIAQDAMLHRGDFPAGWASGPRPVPITSSNCSGLHGRKPAFTARATSSEFTHSDIRTAASAAYLYATAAQATHSFARLSSQATLDCLARVVRRGVEATARTQGVSVGPVRTSRLAFPAVGDQSAAARVSFSVSTGTVKIDADADIVFVRVDRGIMAFSFGQAVAPFDPTLERQLVLRVADRLRSDLARSS